MKGKWNWFQKVGFLLIAVSFLWLLGSELLARNNQVAAQRIAGQILEVIPESGEGFPEGYSNPAMPVLQMEGTDFSAIVRVPAFGITLPVADDWAGGSISAYPRRFWGSAYDDSLILGGSSRQGQFAFCGQMDLGDAIVVTDMTGTEFSYEVAGIDRCKKADMEILAEDGYGLTLFTRESATGKYIVVRCVFSP